MRKWINLNLIQRNCLLSLPSFWSEQLNGGTGVKYMVTVRDIKYTYNKMKTSILKFHFSPVECIGHSTKAEMNNSNINRSFLLFRALKRFAGIRVRFPSSVFFWSCFSNKPLPITFQSGFSRENHSLA